MLDEKFSRLRIHRKNIRRYRRLLETELTELERQIITKRLSEERSALENVVASGFPLAFERWVPAARERPSAEAIGSHG